jgi:hypothetical protein
VQRDEVVGFLKKIDQHIGKNLQSVTGGQKFELKIIGKSALLLAGLSDSVGTVDIDSLGVEGRTSDQEVQNVIDHLLDEYGKAKLSTNGFYLEFVAPAFVFLSQKPEWIALDHDYLNLSVRYLEAHHVIASKFFSAHSSPPRKKDKQDVVAAIDQGIVDFQASVTIADGIFDLHSMDARSDRFPDVYTYITQDLVSKYGSVHLAYAPTLDE